MSEDVVTQPANLVAGWSRRSARGENVAPAALGVRYDCQEVSAMCRWPFVNKFTASAVQFSSTMRDVE